MKQILYILSIVLLSSCAITYEPNQCELILRGEPCLSDHRCCNPPQTYHYQPYPNYHNYWWWKVSTPNYTYNYTIIKPNNKPNKPNNRPNKPNNRPNRTNSKRK